MNSKLVAHLLLACITLDQTFPVNVEERECLKAPQFQPTGGLSRLFETLGSTVFLNCTALLSWDPTELACDLELRWSKDGSPLTNSSMYLQSTSSWSPQANKLLVNSVLVVTLQEEADYGLFTCEGRNTFTNFSLNNVIDSEGPDPTNHVAAVIGAITLFLALAIAGIVYSKCRLNLKLWYRNVYGDYELNDGKMCDAYISYVNNDHDRKFVNFILKPHLENKNGHKVHLNDNDILPGTEPSAELLMNVSRCRRLIVVLSHAYLEQVWCSNDFKKGLLHLLELSHRPIIITLEGQSKRMDPEITHQLREHQHRLSILTWRHNSVIPSSMFWKELALAMPRKVLFHSLPVGDPQTLLQDDKDPMLTLNPDYLDCRPDPDPAGDLGLRLPVHNALATHTCILLDPVAPAAEPKPSDIDVSDLGSRNYGARTDFYCLVTEDF